jgi:hypothetical protein
MLMEIWLNASDQNAITVASHRLDASLAVSPLQFGESRESTVNRLGHEPPLGIMFEVIEDDKRVIVQNVFVVQ